MEEKQAIAALIDPAQTAEDGTTQAADAEPKHTAEDVTAPTADAGPMQIAEDVTTPAAEADPTRSAEEVTTPFADVVPEEVTNDGTEDMVTDDEHDNAVDPLAPAATGSGDPAAEEDVEEEEEEETGVRVQVPEEVAPALVDRDGFGAVARPAPPPRPRIVLWDHLTCDDAQKIRRATTLEQLKEIVGLRCPEVLHPTPNMPSSLLLELLLYVLQYAREQDLSAEQTSVVFSVAKTTHEYATATCFGNVAEAFGYFRDLLAAHCVNRPPWSLDLFEPAQAEHFARFFADMYFRHFSLVKAAFTPYVTLDVDIWYDPRVWRPPEEEALQEGAEPNPGQADTAAAAATGGESAGAE